MLPPSSLAHADSLLLFQAFLSLAHDWVHGQLLVESQEPQGASRLGKGSGVLLLSDLGEGGSVVRFCPASRRTEGRGRGAEGRKQTSLGLGHPSAFVAALSPISQGVTRNPDAELGAILSPYDCNQGIHIQSIHSETKTESGVRQGTLRPMQSFQSIQKLPSV